MMRSSYTEQKEKERERKKEANKTEKEFFNAVSIQIEISWRV